MPIVPDFNQDRFAGLVGMYINATFGGCVFDNSRWLSGVRDADAPPVHADRQGAKRIGE